MIEPTMTRPLARLKVAADRAGPMPGPAPGDARDASDAALTLRAFDDAPAALLLLDMRGRISRANATAVRTFGAEACRRGSTAIWQPDPWLRGRLDVARLKRRFDQVLRAGQAGRVTLERLGSDGTQVLELLLHRVSAEAGHEGAAVLVAAHDRTIAAAELERRTRAVGELKQRVERRSRLLGRARERLRASEVALGRRSEFLEATLDAVEQGVAIYDSAYRLVRWNRRYLELTTRPQHLVYEGVPLEDGVRWLAEHGSFGPGDVEELVRARMALLTGSPGRETEERTMPDGRVVDVAWGHMSTGGLVAVFADVTRHKQIQGELGASERRLAEAQRIALVGDWEWDPATNRVTRSQQHCLNVGLPPTCTVGPIGEAADSMIEPDRDLLEQKIRTCLERAEGFTFDARLWSRSGEQRILNMRLEPVRDDLGRAIRVRGTSQDVTRQRSYEESLRAALIRVSRRDAATPLAVIEWRVRADDPSGWTVLRWSGQAESLLGWRADETLHRALDEIALFPPEDWPEVRAGLAAFAAGEVGDEIGVGRIVTKGGALRHCRWHVSRLDWLPGGDRSLLTLIEDLTGQVEAEERIRRLAHHDSLTDLPNRPRFLEHLAEVLRGPPDPPGGALMLLDLDHFKHVNDTHGHPTGDRLLRAAALRLRRVLRGGDLLARLGGDEFAVLQPGIVTAAEAARTAQRLIDMLTPPFVVDGHELFVGSSIGITLFPRDGDEPEQLLKNADLALYRAKSRGRARYQLYDRGMQDAARRRRSLETDLRQALRQNELRLVYQPQVDLTERRVVGVEALLRWRRRGGEMRLPGSFIDIAETTGLIQPIGAWVLDQVLAQALVWRRDGRDLTVAANLSPAQLRQPGFVGLVREMLEHHGLPPEALEFEVTESLCLDPAKVVLLREVADLGVRIAIDDFGTGYSSLAFLKQVPVGKIKIDRSFVRDIGRDAADEAIIRAVLGLGAGLERRVIAEGVETARQLAYLTEVGCRYVQGHLLGRPMPPERLEAVLSDQARAGAVVDLRAG
jgi:diguanylate cyclase (GGDEF)-like protein/PAS domain S-box-containing protein